MLLVLTEVLAKDSLAQDCLTQDCLAVHVMGDVLRGVVAIDFLQELDCVPRANRITLALQLLVELEPSCQFLLLQ